MYHMPRGFYIILFFVLVAGNISVYRALLAPRALEMTILQAGKSNAVLVHTPYGKTILIDTGPDASILRALGTALPMWQRNITAVILTSPAAGVAGGLPPVQSRYRISKLVRVGDTVVPYGTSLIFDNIRIEIIAPATLIIFYGAATFNISSSTPAGAYISKGKTFILAKWRRLF